MSTTAVHHLNCATFHPPTLGGAFPARMVAHCLLVEGDDGLVLVDTGLGTDDVQAAFRRLGPPFVLGFRPALERQETALEQVQALGFAAEDVRDILVTHLDVDHAGGLPDFPGATVHVFADELEAAERRRALREKGRYQPLHWAHGPKWLPHRVEGERWLDLEGVRVISDDVLLVPLPGHTRGHCAVAVRRPSGGWFLHAGDTYFFAGEKEQPPSCPSGLRAFQSAVQMQKGPRLANAERVRSLHADHGDTVTVFCAHSAEEYDALAGVTD